MYHSGQENNEANRTKFREVIQNAMRSTGFGVHEIGEAAKQEIRMFQGTPGGGLDVLPPHDTAEEPTPTAIDRDSDAAGWAGKSSSSFQSL